MTRFLLVCGAGGLGSGTRYLISLWAGERIGTSFPYGTLIVNLLGSFLMTFLLELSLRVSDFPLHLRIALTTGFMGGLTTYSAFNYESSKLVLDGHYLRGFGNIALTLLGCAAMGLLGLALARKLT
ncbi:MAG TPA: CrcB family protein [Kofleriaceae bacterium]|nr:CrcB family protein [Kofleriaceae bacterium]